MSTLNKPFSDLPPGSPDRGGGVATHVVSRVEFDIDEPDMDTARDAVLRWAGDKLGKDLPEEAWRGESTRADLGDAGKIEAIDAGDHGYWAFRCVLPDPSLASRRWVTEVIVAERKDHLRFGAALIAKTEGEAGFPQRLLPGFVPRIVRIMPCSIDGEGLSCEPWLVDSEGEVEEFVTFLTDPQRRQEVIVLSTAQGSEDPADTITPAERLQFRLAGVARVAILTSNASFALTARIGKDYSLFRQAVRSYRPGFKPGISPTHDHPLALPQRIHGWHGGPDAFFTLLCDHALKGGVQICEDGTELPPFMQIRNLAEGGKLQEAQAGFVAEVPDAAPVRARSVASQPLKEEPDQTEALLAELESRHAVEIARITKERDEALELLAEADATIAELEARLIGVEALLQSGSSQDYTEIPDNFGELEEWAEKHLAGRIVLHSRAIRAAKKSPFEDVPLAYRALLILRDHYLPMKYDGGIELKRAYEEALRQEGMIEEGCFAGNGTGEHGDTYTFTWEGRKFTIDRHLKGSSSRDPRYGFRLYFVWDEETGQVIVASLPGHLKTRAT